VELSLAVLELQAAQASLAAQRLGNLSLVESSDFPPTFAICDEHVYDRPGECPVCGMGLVPNTSDRNISALPAALSGLRVKMIF